MLYTSRILGGLASSKKVFETAHLALKKNTLEPDKLDIKDGFKEYSTWTGRAAAKLRESKAEERAAAKAKASKKPVAE